MDHPMQGLGRVLILLGVVLVAIGALVSWGPRLPWLGRLPGDILVKRDGFTCYAPLATSLLISLLLSLLMWFWNRMR